MPAPEAAYRRQKAVLWTAGSNDRFGQPRTTAPVEIDVRWNNKQTRQLDATGAAVAVDATAVVDQEIFVGSTMWIGELADWYGTGSAGDDSGVMEVITYNEVPDLKNRFKRRTIGLVFYRDTLPTME